MYWIKKGNALAIFILNLFIVVYMTVTLSYLGYFFSYIPIYLFYILQLPGPTCLFYQRDNGDLVPVAIQLMPEPADDNPVGIIGLICVDLQQLEYCHGNKICV